MRCIDVSILCDQLLDLIDIIISRGISEVCIVLRVVPAGEAFALRHFGSAGWLAGLVVEF